MQKFTQCFLVRSNQDGSTSNQMSFIPEEKAIIGNYLKIKDMKEQWSDGWKVEFAGITLPEDQLTVYRDAYRTHRDGTDI